MSGKPLLVNLACGNEKIPNCINIDVEKSCKPDVVWNFLRGLPFKNGTVDELYFFHAIEHIEEKFHEGLLKEFRRVLKTGGKLYISYPEFLRCAENYRTNFRGKRTFWRNTIFGRQLYASDFHVSLMDTRYFTETLKRAGFTDILAVKEPGQEYNTCIFAKAGKTRFYEDVLKEIVFGKEKKK